MGYGQVHVDDRDYIRSASVYIGQGVSRSTISDVEDHYWMMHSDLDVQS